MYVSLQKLEEQDRKALNLKEQLQREHRYLKRRLEQLSVSGSVERIRTDSMGSTISTDSEQGALAFRSKAMILSQASTHRRTLFVPNVVVKCSMFSFRFQNLSHTTAMTSTNRVTFCIKTYILKRRTDIKTSSTDPTSLLISFECAALLYHMDSSGLFVAEESF